jgi:hypothetical protein
MRTQLIAVALLSSTLAVGCGGNDEQNTVNAAPEAPAPVAESAPAPEPATPATSAHTPTTAAPKSKPAAPKIVAQAPRPVAAAKPRFREVTAPAGTELPLELTAAVSSETAQVELPVTARLRRAVVVDGLTVFPAGTLFHGSVTEVERAGRVRGRSHLAFRFTEVAIDEQRDSVATHSVSFEGEATKSEDATKVGAGAGIGAVIGGIVGGGKGAAKGAAIGGAAGAGAVLATRGRDVELAAGAEVNTTLASPFGVRVELE